MAASTSWHLLPLDLIEQQIAQIDLLMAMYSKEEIVIEKHYNDLLGIFKSAVENGSISQIVISSPPLVMVLLNLVISGNNNLQIDINVPFSYKGDVAPEESPASRIRIRQPPWMNRAATTELNSQIPQQEDLFSTIDFINQAAADHLMHAEHLRENQATISPSELDPIVRAWFYFPSISTRSKRDDFIIHAPAYSLTGFLFAGKPGLLCLEGTSQNIDSYMKFIKTESWGDIPAHHKKVSERHREEKVERVFEDMQEITDIVGERRGARANRGDMKAVEEWLGGRGLGDAFTKVLM